jgi:serine/threonine protein phosphatase PrpC
MQRPQTAFDLQKRLMEEPRGEEAQLPRDDQQAAFEALLALGPPMRFTIFQDSTTGDRKGNEDRVGYSYSRDVLLMVIADGMGGHIEARWPPRSRSPRSRAASSRRRATLRSPSTSSSRRSSRRTAPIVSHAVEHNLLECPRTTCVACIVQNGSAYWAHAGDSRLYVLRKGELVARPRTIRACSR